jgi:hypothetical protein
MRGYAFNKSRYTALTAPPHIRRKWAMLGLKIRRKIAPFRRRLKGLEADLESCNRRFWTLSQEQKHEEPIEELGEEAVVASELPAAVRAEAEPLEPGYSPAEEDAWRHPRRAQARLEQERRAQAMFLKPSRRRARAANPELLLVGNNPGYGRRANKGGRQVRRRRSRRKGRNLPLTIRTGGRRHTFRALVKRYGVTGASKLWRRKKKFHGYTKKRVSANRGRRRRSRSRNRRRSFRSRRRSRNRRRRN